MGRSKRRMLAGTILSVLVSGAAAASGDPAAAPSVTSASVERDFTLDEYSAMLSGASDFWQLGASLTFGDSLHKRYYLFGGGQLTWVQASEGARSSSGLAIGVLGGVGYRPQRKYSPVASVAADWLFGVDDLYRSKLTLSGGVRIRVVPQLDPQQAVSVLLFVGRLDGATGVSDRTDSGVTVLYSLAFYDQH